MTYEPTPAERVGQRVALGCFTAVAGAAGGGMLGTLVSKVVGTIRSCDPGEGLPACDWHVYAAVGILLGVTIIPSIAFVRLRRSERADRPTA